MKISIAAVVLMALMGSSEAAPHSEAVATPYQSQVRRLPPAYDYLVQLGLSEFTEQISPAIIGGSPADIANFPFQLNLRHAGSSQCGASIISSLWALTAAHCVDNGIVANLVTFRAGSADRSAGGTIYTADQYILHPQYNRVTFFMDVAVVRVTAPFAGPNISIIPLAPVNLDTPAGSRAVVSGWGLNDNSIYPLQLLYVDVPIVSRASCLAVWGNLITAEVICAGEFGRDSCNGDSGGPMTSGGLQIGIVSWGATNCGGNAPGVYASVSHPSIRSFITQHTGV